MRSPGRNISRGMSSSRRTTASPPAPPRSTTTLPYSTRLTWPLMISPMRSLNTSYCLSRSASRIFCTRTCFEACAGMRPYSKGGSDSAIQSPSWAEGFFFCASASVIWVASFSTSSTTSSRREKRISPVFGLISARTSVSCPYRERAAFCIASSIEASTIERSIDFSRATASTICKSSSLLALTAIGVSFVGLERLWRRAASHGFPVRIGFEFGGLRRGPGRVGGGPTDVLQRGLFAPESKTNEIVGQHKPRLAHGADRQLDVRLAFVVGRQQNARRRPVRPWRDGLDQSTEPFTSVDRRRHLDARLVADCALEIRLPNKRPVDAGGGNLEPIGLGHDVLDVEYRRERRAGPLAVVNRHRAVWPLGHDLHRRPGGRRDPDPHEPQSEVAQHRRGDASDAQSEPTVLDEARLVQSWKARMFGFDHSPWQQKRAGPRRAHSQKLPSSPRRRAMRLFTRPI